MNQNKLIEIKKDDTFIGIRIYKLFIIWGFQIFWKEES